VRAIQAFLGELIDYAGLFPPAGLALPIVVRQFHQYSLSDNRWMLGRLIVPARQLADLRGELDGLFSDASPASRWRISSLMPEFEGTGDAFRQSLEQIERFNQWCPHAVVDTIEGKLTSAASIDQTIHALPASLSAFLEMPFSGAGELIRAIASSQTGNLRGKMRTGGITSDLIPGSSQVAAFMAACAAARLPFKATAGLHHPLRAVYPLTYETSSTRDTMHGFLNVFTASIFAWCRKWPESRLVPILDCTDASAFRFDNGHLHFQTERVSTEEISDAREHFAISFGSCSFVEPSTEITPFHEGG
jgi:hypothetical protein